MLQGAQPILFGGLLVLFRLHTGPTAADGTVCLQQSLAKAQPLRSWCWCGEFAGHWT